MLERSEISISCTTQMAVAQNKLMRSGFQKTKQMLCSEITIRITLPK